MIIIHVFNDKTSAEAQIEIPDEHAPAFRSAVQEIRNELGERLTGSFLYAKEEALTRASSTIGLLARAVNKVIPKEDPDYE